MPSRAQVLICCTLLSLLPSGCGGGFVAEQISTIPYRAFGDSITFGATLDEPATQAYPHLLAGALSLHFFNDAITGDQACDVFPHQIYAHTVGYATIQTPMYTLMIGTNDVNGNGAGDYESNFNNCQSATLAWLGTLPSDRLLPGDASLTVTGGCINQPSSSSIGGLACARNRSGSITATAFATNGRPIYIWYGFGDDADPLAVFTVSIDQASPHTVSIHPASAISTQMGTRNSVGILRLPVPTGAHTVTIQTTGGISIQAIGTNRSTAPIPLAVGDLPNQLLSNPVATIPAQLTYSADIQANIASAIGDGIDARFVPVRKYLLGNNDEMNDQLHPNALGQQHLATAFRSVLR